MGRRQFRLGVLKFTYSPVGLSIVSRRSFLDADRNMSDVEPRDVTVLPAAMKFGLTSLTTKGASMSIGTMKAAIFVEPERIVLDEKPIPDVGPLDALIRITTTTICGTDVHILKGEYPVEKGLTIGHEPVGVIEKLGSAVKAFTEGQRVIAGAITPSGYSNACQCGSASQDGDGSRHGWKAMGDWKFGNTIDGCRAEFVPIPDAMTNLAEVPDGLSDEQVLMCPDIMSTGFSEAERGDIKIGDVVAIFAQAYRRVCYGWCKAARCFDCHRRRQTAHRIGLALVIILLMLAAILAFIATAWRQDRVTAWLFVPYPAWVAFASVLNGSIWALN
jgi:hypothetical protein